MLASKEEVLKEIMDILTNLGIPESMLKKEANLKQDLQMDSVETVQLAMEVKKRFNVVIKLESSREFTIQDICELISKETI